MARSNYLLNPSFEVDATNWTAANCTITRAATVRPERVGGFLGVITVTSPAGAVSVAGNAAAAIVVPGQWVTASMLVGRDTGATHASVAIQWYAGGSPLSTTTGVITALSATNLVRLSVSGVAPATATTARLLVLPVAGSGGGTPPAGVTLIDAGMLVVGATQGLAEAAALPAFDGSTTDTSDWTYAWTGTVGASTSTEVATPGVYVARTDDPGAPQAGILITGLDPGTPSIITVETSWDGGESWHSIRGGTNVEVQDEVFFRDFVPALNVETCYRVRVISGPGFLVPLRLQDCLLIEDPNIWLQDPLNPRTAVSMTADCTVDGSLFLAADSLTSAVLAQSFDIATVMDSSLGVASIGRRMLASRVPLNVAYRTMAENGGLRKLLMTSGQIVLRGLPNTILPPVAHVVMGPAKESRSSQPKHEISVFEFEVNQVRPLAISVVIPWWTYDQVAAIWAATTSTTYDAVIATRPGATYVDWQSDPEPS